MMERCKDCSYEPATQPDGFCPSCGSRWPKPVPVETAEKTPKKKTAKKTVKRTDSR